ncbi:MAG: protein kinase [Ignisphaera sp.]
MFLRVCRDIDKVSEHIFDPVIFSSIMLIKGGKFLRRVSDEAKNLAKLVLEIIRESPDTSLMYFRFDLSDKIYRVIALKDIALAIAQEDSSGQVQLYGIEALQSLSKIFNSSINVKMIVEELPLSQLDSNIVESLKPCIEEAEKIYISLWKRRGLYWFIIEDVVSDKGSYTYVFKACDKQGNTYALKVLKEDIVVGRRFMDVIRGYIQGLVVATVDDREFIDLLELKGYDKAIMKDLILYKKYITLAKALFIVKDKLDKDEYINHPPTIVEEYASLGDLERYIQLNGARSLEETMYILIRIVGAVALAHLFNIVHLDIKPRNILIYSNENENYKYTPKLNDFSGAVGDPNRGYKFVRITPGYSDPLALAKGVADFGYDAYSIAMVVAYILTGQLPKHRLALNIIMLQNLYNYPIPMEKIGDDEKPLKEFIKKIIDTSLQLRSKSISIHNFVESINEDLEHLDTIYMPWINDIPKSIASVIKKALTLDTNTRYKNGIDMWLETKEALVKEKMDNLIPR